MWTLPSGWHGGRWGRRRAPVSSPSPAPRSAVWACSGTAWRGQGHPGGSERPPETIRKELFKAICNATCDNAKVIFLQA